MKFIDQEAENYFKKLVEEFGYIHLNTGGKEITMDSLIELRTFLEKQVEYN
ncbi:hypothetical protein [Anaerosolibacter sp.]|uniref:hypothetical protein n=1 Tax=Anaerosolibacter sp. TaxID=1872527 RepID=UPI0039EF5AFD